MENTQQKTETLPNGQTIIINMQQEPKSTKSRAVYVLLCLFLGVLGVHNFYRGCIIGGLLELILIGPSMFLTSLFPPMIVFVFIFFIILFCELFASKDGNGLRMI